jgi:two-component system heavy metal sensor histidine kinase CusS
VRADQGGEGSGLGLAIARSIVLAHGGNLTARSSGEITEFSLTLPLTAAQPGIGESKSAAASP